MNHKQAAELLLQRMNRLTMNNGFFGSTDGTIGNINLLQKDMNHALTAWHESRDAAGLKQMAGVLHVYGHLTDAEYEQIMEALDGEQ